jgi:pimeloyl-ACP methyl ester carboxylesterase
MLSILLPGLDGTGDLFAAFVAAAPPGFIAQSWRLPSDEPLSYRELADWVTARLPKEPLVLIAESFSGPLGVLVAERCPNVSALVLCASFVVPPGPRLFAHAPQFIWHRPPPVAAISLFMTGGRRALAATLQRAMSSVSPAVVAARMAAVLTVDVSAELQKRSMCSSALN